MPSSSGSCSLGAGRATNGILRPYFPAAMLVQAETEAVSGEALTVLARAVMSAAQRPGLAAALDDLAGAARTIAGAEVALIRVAAGDRYEAVSVAGPPALAAELEGTQRPAADVPDEALECIENAPRVVQRAAARSAARSLLLVPIRIDGVGATLELYRSGGAFGPSERVTAELAAGQTALVLRALAGDGVRAVEAFAHPALELAGEALAAALDQVHTAPELVRVAATIVGAPVAILWERREDGSLDLVATYGLDPENDVDAACALAAEALDESGPVRAVPAEQLPGACGVSTTLPLGQPAIGLLQLLFEPNDVPDAEQLERLTTFGVRVAHALRASARARTLGVELERTRALLAVVGQATAELSLAHTLDTAAQRMSELFGIDDVVVYLRGEEDRLVPAAGKALTGPHARVAERLLEIALGPARGSPVVEVADLASDERLHDTRDSARESGIEAAFGAPLVVRDAVIGLLAVYAPRGRRPNENEAALLAALAGQLAVAVQNAQLHERIAATSTELEASLASGREAAKRLSALYEISRSFAQSLSLEATLEALANTVVDVLDVDAAVLRMPDARREWLAPRAVHVKDPLLAAAARMILSRPQAFGAAHVQRLFRDGAAYRIGRGTDDLLDPFLEKGWTAAVVPVATPAEVVASLSIFSFRPGNPSTEETIDAATAIAGQAALAIDNARLYQQQKEFADTMQRSLLPRHEPQATGLDVGEVYESSA